MDIKRELIIKKLSQMSIANIAKLLDVSPQTAVNVKKGVNTSVPWHNLMNLIQSLLKDE